MAVSNLSKPDALDSIPFIDLAAQRERLRDRLDLAIARVLDHGQFIMGPEVQALERRLADYTGARHCISCANGTDALMLVLMAEGIGPGDAVLVPSFTFVAPAEAVCEQRATPVFCDVQTETFCLEPASLAPALDAARREGLTPRAVVAVDLFGQPADYQALHDFAQAHGLVLIADGAQSFGATLNGRRVGTFADYTTTSFFPAKPLGCYGDGGAVFTDDEERAERLRSLRLHGKGSDKYDNVRIGLNSRLDTLQAAILLEKMEILDDEIERRGRVAGRYSDALSNLIVTPEVADDATSVWAQYTTLVPGDRRDAIAGALKESGVPTAVYYPTPIHRLAAYRDYPVAPSLANSERLSDAVLSLPMHPYLDGVTQDRIVHEVGDALRG